MTKNEIKLIVGLINTPVNELTFDEISALANFVNSSTSPKYKITFFDNYKIAAIEFYRELTKASLKDAKDGVEQGIAFECDNIDDFTIPHGVNVVEVS